MYIDSRRKMFFNGEYGGRLALDYLPPETAERWWAEAAALECSSCNVEECAFRFKEERLPEDAGGNCQCIRWAEKFTPLAWRNPDGRVIVMPQEILDAIRA